jgi:hypothetical protein
MFVIVGEEVGPAIGAIQITEIIVMNEGPLIEVRQRLEELQAQPE